jgi:hypothetical protein
MTLNHWVIGAYHPVTWHQIPEEENPQYIVAIEHNV